MNTYFNGKPVSLDEVLDRYPAHEFESPTRSTVPLLTLLKGSIATKSLLEMLDLTYESLDAHLEFKVPPVKGEGKASHSDLMLIQNGSYVAIEAKRTEPPYDTVKQWLGRGLNRTNRRTVLDGWLSLLQPYSERLLGAADFNDAIYQMVHRAASACHVGPPARPALAYIQFSPLPPATAPDIKFKLEQLQSALSRFRHLLGTTHGFPFFLVEVTATPTEAFNRISGLARGSRKTASLVRTALRAAPLFEFKDFRLHPV